MSLHCDVKAFNEWFSEKVEQLKQNGILDTELHWLRSILFTSYEKSTDPLFKAYIEQQKDYLRDNPDKSKDFTWKLLMSRASKKVDSLLIDSKRASNNKGNPILALEAKLKNQQTVIQQLVHEHQASNGKGKSNSNRKKHDKGKKGKRTPFPDELKSKPRPDDPNKAVTIAGNDYYWCDEHKKWGRHKTSQCHKRNGKPDTTRGSRIATSLKALVMVASSRLLPLSLSDLSPRLSRDAGASAPGRHSLPSCTWPPSSLSSSLTLALNCAPHVVTFHGGVTSSLGSRTLPCTTSLCSYYSGVGP